MPQSFSIAQVSPYPWEAAEQEVNRYIAALSAGLASRGHGVLILSPTASGDWATKSRAEMHAARESKAGLQSILPTPGEVRVLAIGEAISFGSSRRGSQRNLPLDQSRTIEDLLSELALDFVHVHEPFPPGAASAALRASRALNIGTFHQPTERLHATQVVRKFIDTFFGRLDGRSTTLEETRKVMSKAFSGRYSVIRPTGTPLPELNFYAPGAPAPTVSQAKGKADELEIAFVAGEERQALRLFLRGLRRLPEDLNWRATVWSPSAMAPPTGLRSDVRDRLRFADASQLTVDELFESADVSVFCSAGASPTPTKLLRAVVAGAVPLAPRLPSYEEVLEDGDVGLLFEAGDVDNLSAQLERLVRDKDLRASLSSAVPKREWSAVTDAHVELYETVAARRHTKLPDPAVAKRIAERELIDVDLHMHTDHSHDCATPVEVLLEQAKKQGLGAIAITDHNEVSGALEAEAKAEGIKIIVAEEVKTASQGEVIGLFIREKIPRGLTLAETIDEIKRQGGVVYVPHPFDRLHSVPDYEHLLEEIERIDAIEIFNPRIAIGAFNEEAVRFAAKYRIPAGAGSDAHVPQGLGSVRIRMRDFDGPEEFMASLRDADVIRKPASLLYVQALKFIQNKATPEPARRASRKRRIRRSENS